MDLTDLVRPVVKRARANRMELLRKRFPDLEQMKIVDLGGHPQTWDGVRTGHVTVVNIDDVPDAPGIESIVADACTWEGRADLVFSNSLLEHVGGFHRRVEFARNVDRISSLHWIQTPYRHFPIEPHWIFPLLQYLPVNLRAGLSRVWRLGYSKTPTYESALREVLQIELIGKVEMAFIFPKSEIIFERWAGLPKSMIAVKSS